MQHTLFTEGEDSGEKFLVLFFQNRKQIHLLMFDAMNFRTLTPKEKLRSGSNFSECFTI